MAVRTMNARFDAKAWEAGTKRDQPDGFDVRYEGAVLATFEKNGYDDSDFYAVVWDDEKGRVTTTCYASTSGWTYPNSATADATDEVLAKVAEWAKGATFARMVDKDRADARRVQVGRQVRVTKGRTRGKRPVETGTLGWVAAIKPGWDRGTEDVVLQVEGSLVYIGKERVEVVDPEQFETDEDELRGRANRSVEHGDVTSIAASLVRTLVVGGELAAWF